MTASSIASGDTEAHIRPVVKEPDFELSYTKDQLQRGFPLVNLLRSTLLAVVLLLSFFLASTWISRGTGWLFDSRSGRSPLLSCPSIMGYNGFNDARYCKVTISPWSAGTYFSILQNDKYAMNTDDAKAAGLCVMPYVDSGLGLYGPDQQPIECYSKQPCYETTDWYPLNPYSAAGLTTYGTKAEYSIVIQGMLFPIEWFEMSSVEAYCDASFNLRPSAIIAIRGLLFGLVALYLLMVAYDVIKCLKINRLNSAILRFRATGLAESIKGSRQELMQKCLMRWNTLISRTTSIVSQPVTPSSSSSPRALPFQPILSPRKSFAFKTKESPVGYSPRMDSPPVHVMSAISLTNSRLTRAHGAVEVMFATTWRKRVSKYFRMRTKILRELQLPAARRVAHVVLSVLFFISLFTLIFRFVLWVTSELPLTRQIPGNLSMVDLIGLGADRTGSIPSIMGQDIRSQNALKKPALYLWTCLVPFVDVLYEAAWLLLFAFIALLKPTKQTASRNQARGTSGDDLHPHVSAVARKKGFTPETTFADLEEDGDETRSQIMARFPQFVPRSRRESLTTSSIGNFEVQEMDNSVLSIMISVMSPCATGEGRKLFIDQLQSLRSLVENDRDIFVVDCGFTRSPIDDTESVIRNEVSEKLNYIYFPEPNRLVSLYWTSKYWIPFLFTSGLCGDYIYSLILDGESGICFPPDFKLPSAEFLLANPNVKAMYLPVSESANLVSWPSRLRERINLLWISNLFGSTTHAGGYGIPQIWERNAFEMTCFNLSANTNADPQMYRALSLKANGRNLLKDRCKSRMITWLPQNGAQPVLRRNVWNGEEREFGFLANLRELIELPSLLHPTSLVSKTAVFNEILGAACDVVRIFFVAAMILRDPIGFAVIAVIVALIASLPLVANVLVSARYETHVAGKTFFLLLVQPFVLLFLELPRRTVRLFKLKIVPTIYKVYESDVTIGEREEQHRDLPIVPPHPFPHWSTVWA